VWPWRPRLGWKRQEKGKRRAGRGGVISGTVAVGSPTLLGSASRIPKLQAAALDTRGHASERRDAQPRFGRRGWGGTNVRVDAMVILPFEP
jgi:hypothetical protein